MVGGPKVFSYKPKKTWSGVLAGWLAVGIFSWYFVECSSKNLFFTFVSISVLLSAAAQIGDMIQSHLKRVLLKTAQICFLDWWIWIVLMVLLEQLS